MSLSVLFDLRPSFGPVRNQGARPTCLAFAVSDAHAAARGSIEALSAEHLYFHAVQRTPGGHPRDGVTLRTILDALRLDGQSAETGWPYLDSLPADLKLWLPPATAQPVFKRESVTGPSGIDLILGYLASGMPTVITLMISVAFCQPEGGIVTARPADPDLAWHAVIAVGEAKDSDRRLLLIRNSWGEAWGIGGYAWIDSEYLAPRLSSVATIKPDGANK